MFTAPEEQKIAKVRNLTSTTEVEILRENVRELQKQLNAAHIRIKELLVPDSATEEELIRKVMAARGVNPNDPDEVVDFWSDYHGISKED